MPSKTLRVFPWAGLLALAGAEAAVALLLSGPVSPAAMLHTWNLSRAAGFVAYLLLWAAVCLGLLQSLGVGWAGAPGAAGARVDIHCFLSAAALYATAFHAMILLWDRYMPFGWTDILLPFAGRHEPFLVGIGSVAFYLALLATVTTYLRHRLDGSTWRQLHRLTLVGFVLAFLHGVYLGSDSQTPAVQLLYAATGMSAGALAVVRLSRLTV